MTNKTQIQIGDLINVAHVSPYSHQEGELGLIVSRDKPFKDNIDFFVRVYSLHTHKIHTWNEDFIKQLVHNGRIKILCRTERKG